VRSALGAQLQRNPRDSARSVGLDAIRVAQDEGSSPPRFGDRDDLATTACARDERKAARGSPSIARR
jgi:hypothetical protein